MVKKIYLLCPSIQDGGLEKTLSIYANFLTKKFQVNLVTNTFNNKRLKTFHKKLLLQKVNLRSEGYATQRLLRIRIGYPTYLQSKTD